MAKPNISAEGKYTQAILMGSTAKSHGAEGGLRAHMLHGVAKILKSYNNQQYGTDGH